MPGMPLFHEVWRCLLGHFSIIIRQIAETCQKRYSRYRVPPAAPGSRCAVPTRSAPSWRARSAAVWCRLFRRMGGSPLVPTHLPRNRLLPVRNFLRVARRFRQSASRQPVDLPWRVDVKQVLAELQAASVRFHRPIGGRTRAGRLRIVNQRRSRLGVPQFLGYGMAGNVVGPRRPSRRPSPAAWLPPAVRSPGHRPFRRPWSRLLGLRRQHGGRNRSRHLLQASLLRLSPGLLLRWSCCGEDGFFASARRWRGWW